MPPADGRPKLRELSRTPQFLPLSAANGKPLESGSPREQQRRGGGFITSLLSRQYAVYWLVWLLLCGCFAIRHTTKLLDAASHQHALLAQPTTTAAAAVPKPMQQQLAQHSSSSSSTAGNVSTTAAAVLAAQHSKWPDGYVAVCAVIKDQWPDLRYWIEYHRWLGVSKFYIYDNNSTLPAMLMLWDYMQAGVVEYEYFLGRPRRRPDFTDTNQYRAYQGCLLQHFKQHRWLAFIDADEFFVLTPNSNSSKGHSSSSAGSGGSSSGSSTAGKPFVAAEQQLPTTQQEQQQQPAQEQHFGIINQLGSVITQDAVAGPGDTPSTGRGGSSAVGSNSTDMYQHDLALFLSEYEGQAALGVNWVLFGSSGHLVRPAEGPLAAYTACIPRTHWESTHVKVIANTGGVLGIGGTPHEVMPRSGKSIVDVDKVPFKGPKTPQAKWHKLVLHHYVLKSKAEFVAKQARGSGAGNKKDWGYWEYVEKLANNTCLEGVPVSKAFMASQPALGLSQSAHVLQGCHQKATAAYDALLQSQGGGSTEHAEGHEDIELLPC